MKRLILVTALGLATSTFPALAGPGDAFRNTVVNWNVIGPKRSFATLGRLKLPECTIPTNVPKAREG